MNHPSQPSPTFERSSSPTPRRGTSVRLVLLGGTLAMTMLAIVISGGLVWVSTALHRTTADASGAVESIRLAEEAVSELAHLMEADGASAGASGGEGLRAKMLELRSHTSTARGKAALAKAEKAVDIFLTDSRDLKAPKNQLEAERALEELVLASVERARAAQAEAQRWDAMANRAGFVLSAVLLGGGVATIVWLRRRAFAPLLRLARTMERFGRGDRDARADEAGAEELRDMSRRFNEMAAALSAQRSQQIAFLGGVAHDLRGPLSVLKVSLGVLGPTNPLPSEAKLRQSLARMERQLAHLERMVGDFLEVSRIEGSGLELQLDTHDARLLVQEVASCFVELAGPRMRVGIPNAPVPLCCDGLRIQQVLTNLVSNAVKYSPPDTTIDVTLSSVREQVEVSVRDRGVGISEEEQTFIFEPFRRVGLSKERVPGVGLGLYVVRRIVEAHAGRIEVTSTPGQGATFRVLLPRAPSHTGRVAQQSTGAPQPAAFS